MTVLGIETATAVCGVAICQDGNVLAKSELEERNIHAEKIFELMHEAVANSGLSFSSIDGIGVSIGPGSFTGLRIGLSVAKGLAYSTGKTLLAVPTLEALAYRVLRESPDHPESAVLSVLDARRDDVYCQLFNINGNELISEWPPRVMHVAEVVREMGVGSAAVIGDGSSKLVKAAAALGYDTMFHVVPDDVNKCTASTIAVLGEKMLGRNESIDPVTAEPHYMKEFFETR